MVRGALREQFRSARKSERRAIGEDRGFSRDVPVARGEVCDLRPAPHHSSSRATFLVPAMYGGESAFDLRRKLRRRAGPQSRAGLKKNHRATRYLRNAEDRGKGYEDCVTRGRFVWRFFSS